MTDKIPRHAMAHAEYTVRHMDNPTRPKSRPNEVHVSLMLDNRLPEQPHKRLLAGSHFLAGPAHAILSIRTPSAGCSRLSSHASSPDVDGTSCSHLMILSKCAISCPIMPTIAIIARRPLLI